MKERVASTLVLGAGVVGLSTALYLQRAGRPVTVIDPLAPGGGASFGNAGLISADTSIPIALPGMLRKVPGWLTDRLGPLSVDPLYFPKALPWLLRWIEASRMPRVLKISDAMRALHRTTFDCWKELLGPSPVLRPHPPERSGPRLGERSRNAGCDARTLPSGSDRGSGPNR